MKIERLKQANRLLHKLDKIKSMQQLERVEMDLKEIADSIKMKPETMPLQVFLYEPRGHVARARFATLLKTWGLKVPLVLRPVTATSHKVKATNLSEFMGFSGYQVDRAFRRMGIAEQNIQDAIKQSPDKKDLLWNSFFLLAPPAIIENLNDALYDWHTYELLERVRRGNTPLEHATKAEIMGYLSQASLQVPPRHVYSLIYNRLFKQLFPEKYMTYFGKQPVVREDYPGEFDEELWKLRLKFVVPGRTLAKLKQKVEETKQSKALPMPVIDPGAKRTARPTSLLDYFK